ncbi:acetyl-CoA carboxylase biotin carboxyl carrier protein [Nitrolancea hollandica]|uniref:Biotin carboxyl carrier protein of acetyl-CoA carboxylase n=1 Tax=Nitrolancea hollandica Lb TaxID=1129897 RepID=I4EFH4_9BACT|nr:acetyl-CoA carboxylase biotin carboxyl carrier protein [Nitrolancea hollandica]CCF83436.1 Acetyl-CoA carboxylase, biotin carboxyl carrier protein [Nitrolancea hollandica Lb]
MTTRDPDEPDSLVSGEAAEYRALTEAIRDLIKVMHEGDIGRLEVERGDLRISLTARELIAPPTNGVQPQIPPAITAGPPPAAVPAPAPVVDDHLYVVTSPMIGTFYASSAPGERPFVQTGDEVEAGQTVAIIEAMKIMNEIVAEQAGVVEAILVTNGETVEYGHPLMRLRPLS